MDATARTTTTATRMPATAVPPGRLLKVD
jgi:hypothetical protein